MGKDVGAVLGMWGLFSMIAWIVWVGTTNRRREKIAQAQSEMLTKLLDKMSANQDLAEYLKSDAGQRLLQPSPIEPRSPFGRILGSIQGGVVMTLLGMALLTLSRGLMDAEQGLLVVGTICFAVGLGLLISSGISYALSKSWGLLERNGPTQR
jgi:hypothetical protein